MGFNNCVMTLIFLILFLLWLFVVLIFLFYKLHLGRVEHRKMRRLIERLRLSNSKLSRYVDLDDLTAAQSRRYLVERIDRPERTETHALLYVDLDDFKTVNDTYGHDVGDALLIEVTDAMVAACRPGDFVALLGGDEFCVFLKGCDLERGGQVAHRFLQAVVEANVEVAGRRVIRTASIGVCELRPDQKMESALNVADAALYEAKSKGKNQILAGDHEVVRRMRQKQSRPSAEEVGAALENGEITYFVKPIFDLEQDRIEGVEALIRWVKPDGEILLPGQFLDLMADSYKRGVRPPLEAANEAAIGFSKLDPPIYCGWNISSKFLNNTVIPGLDADWLKALFNGLPPEMTVFEIVESTVIDNPEATKTLIKTLRSRDVRIALDDFGIGMSNLERLLEYPIDIVKIDRSFVQSQTRESREGIMHGLVEMSKTMGFQIIAEGIETQSQLDLVSAAGITHAQGYFLGKPQTANYWLEEILRQRSQKTTSG